MHKAVVVLIAKGEEKKDVLKILCDEIVGRHDPGAAMTSLMKTAVEDVVAICKCLKQLMGAAGKDLNDIDHIMGAKTGFRNLVKNSILQNGFFKKSEATLRAHAIADATLMPKVAELMEGLTQEKPDWSQLGAMVQSLPSWTDRLRPGARRREAKMSGGWRIDLCSSARAKLGVAHLL